MKDVKQEGSMRKEEERLPWKGNNLQEEETEQPYKGAKEKQRSGLLQLNKSSQIRTEKWSYLWEVDSNSMEVRQLCSINHTA